MSTFIHAYATNTTEGWALESASPKREWMDTAPQKLPYRCLPMIMANQAGWIVRCPIGFKASWTGGEGLDSLKLEFGDGPASARTQVNSNFGMGIITFRIPWIFRTSRGYGLLARGPANYWIDGVIPLEGLVETDWSPASFTMNWKILRRNNPVWFKRGDPICMLVPTPLDLLDTVEPAFRNIDENPQLKEDFEAFNAARWAQVRGQLEQGVDMWKRDYLRGHLPDGTPVNEHRTNFKLKPFST
jgi:hypothetical protein